MPGTITVRPIEAKFTHDSDFLTKMDPYCTVHIGNQKVKGQVCKSGGKHPQWKDTMTILRGSEPTMIIELKDKDTFTKDDLIGVCQVDLNPLDSKNNISRWYPVFNNKKPAGEILVELTYTPAQAKYPLNLKPEGIDANLAQQGPNPGNVQPTHPSSGPCPGTIPAQMQQGPTIGTTQQNYPSGGQQGGMIPTQAQQGPNSGNVQPNYPSSGQGYSMPTGQMNQEPTFGGPNLNVIPAQFNAPNAQPSGFGQPNFSQQQFAQGGYNQGQSGYAQPQGGMMQGQGGFNQGGAYPGNH